MAGATTRVLALLELLEAGGTFTASALAERLAVDERTVRRYVEHLLELGVPVRAVRGRYGGYRLGPGYRMPPLMLTDDESVAVLLGLGAIDRAELAPGEAVAAQSASAKILRVLPERLRRRLQSLLDTATCTAPVGSATPPETDVLLLAAQAVNQGRALRIDYRSRDGRDSERMVRPSSLVVHSGRWYLTASDSMSGEERTFRLDRVQTAILLTESFAAPEQRASGDQFLSALARAPRQHGVSVLVNATAHHIQRRIPPGLATVDALTDDGGPELGHVQPGSAPSGQTDPWLRLRLQVEDLTWVPALLAWVDRPFVIETPDELRGHVASLANRLQRHAARR